MESTSKFLAVVFIGFVVGVFYIGLIRIRALQHDQHAQGISASNLHSHLSQARASIGQLTADVSGLRAKVKNLEDRPVHTHQ